MSEQQYLNFCQGDQKYLNFTGIRDNFSYETVAEGKTVCIPVNQQMIVHDLLIIEGTLKQDGEVVVFE